MIARISRIDVGWLLVVTVHDHVDRDGFGVTTAGGETRQAPLTRGAASARHGSESRIEDGKGGRLQGVSRAPAGVSRLVRKGEVGQARGRERTRASRDRPAVARTVGNDSGRRDPAALLGRAPLLLPAAAERAIDLDERRQLGLPGLGEPQLRDEEARVGVEHFEVARRAALVADVGEPSRVLRRGRQALLLLAELAGLRVADQRVGRFAKRAASRSARRATVASCGARLRERDLRSRAAGGEDRLRRR